jgi:hypothetical protein
MLAQGLTGRTAPGAGPDRAGFTLPELVTATAAGLIVVVAIGVILVDNQRSWQKMYDSIYTDVVTDSYIARRKFDATVRKSSSKHVSVGSNGSWIEVGYYSDTSSVDPDRYGLFYPQDGSLLFERGTTGPRQTTGTETVCGNVSSCFFTVLGQSARMSLTLDNGTESTRVICSSVMHN